MNNFTFAKIRNENYELLLSEGVFTIPDFEDAEMFCNKTNGIADDGTWRYIEKYTEKEFAIKDLPQESTSLNYINKQNFDAIDFIVSLLDNNYYCFQKVKKQQIIKKKFISFDSNNAVLKEEPNLFIQDIPDAVYEKNTDRLYFRNIRALGTLFKGIEELFREATEEETKTFLNIPLIKLANGYNAGMVKTANRRRITIVDNDTLDKIMGNRREFIEYVSDYSSELKCENDQILISSDSELKFLLYGINERYYTTPFTKEKFAAKMMEPMSKN